MGKVKVTFDEFKDIKKHLWVHTAKSTANKFDRHLSTIINIKGCKNFVDYEELVKSEHQPTQDSLADRVYELHKMVFMKPGITYFKPPTARKAVIELQLREQKLRKASR